MKDSISIAGRRIGPGMPSFIIAEAGVNHNGDLDLARQLVVTAAKAGADAVKFQTFRAEKLVSRSAPKASYQIDKTRSDESQYQMLQRLELSPDMHVAVIESCRQAGILFLSTPFDEDSADLLERLGVPAFKIGSGDLTNLSLLRHVARKKKPMIVSTGMACLSEVEAALQAIVSEGNDEVVLLHCVSSYPAAPEDLNLRAMATMAAAFGVPVGYSDHSVGIEIALAAAALGATVIEKHITMDRNLPGPDHTASLEPAELTAMVRGIRSVEAALGDGHKRPRASEKSTAEVARRSIIAATDLRQGTLLTAEQIAIQRPGTGLQPSMLPHLLGRRLRVDVAAGSLLTWEMFA
jgi:N,N'-diacetyllegionaminate synthase